MLGLVLLLTGCPKNLALQRDPPPSLMDPRIAESATTGQLAHRPLSTGERDARTRIPLDWLTAADLPCPSPWEPTPTGFLDKALESMVDEDQARLAHQPVALHFCVADDSIDPRLIRSYPQIQSTPSDANYDVADPRSVSRQVGAADLPPADLELGTLRLDGARTDVVSASFLHGGFLVSERARGVLEQFELGPHVFVPTTVVHDKQEHAYFWFQVDRRQGVPVDWSRSAFVTHGTRPLSHEIRFTGWADMNAYHETMRQRGYVMEFALQRLVLGPDFAWDRDVFVLPLSHTPVFSKRLIEALEASGLTGWEYATTRQLFVAGELDDSTLPQR